MQAVGRIGSYISKSVYTVSGPFHPFGGAVDIIVVEQPDGSYKSSPWYVRFGKFQGVLKTKEKVVDISVNGVEADFHMFLNHKGEAYFLREVNAEEVDSPCSPSSLFHEDTGRISGNRNPIVRTNSRRSQILGLVFGRRSSRENGDPEENGSGVIRTESLERAEIAANLLDLKWSTNLASSRLGNDYPSQVSADDISKNANENLPADVCKHNAADLISHSSSTEAERTIADYGIGVKCLSPEVVMGTVTSTENIGDDAKVSNLEPMALTENSESDQEVHILDSVAVISEILEADSQIKDAKHEQNGSLNASFSTEENSVDNLICYRSETLKSPRVGLEESFEQLDNPFCCGVVQEVGVHTETTHILRPSVKSIPEAGSCTVEEHLKLGNLSHDMTICADGGPLFSASQNFITESYSEEISHQLSSGFIEKVEVQNVVTILEDDQIDKSKPFLGLFEDPQVSNSEVIRRMLLSGNSEEEELLFGKMDDFDSCEVNDSECCHSDEKVKETNCSHSTRVADGVCGGRDDASMPGRRLRTSTSYANISSSGLVQSEITRRVRSLPNMSPLNSNFDQSITPQSMGEDGKSLHESKGDPASRTTWDLPRTIDSFRGSQRGWSFPFRRARSIRESPLVVDGREYPSMTKLEKSPSDLLGPKDATKVNINKKSVRTNIPTSEQLASLNLKEGKNTVIFTFSTAMLGKQQVDACIFLWRWDSRIVISDVDGTITRSDLLGQVMPWVGMDWSQTGVAHLFTAIKDNGYQLLFLSARSISQAFHTRQFLFNIKQDGKALPDGPVVISPDGLFPSLFREVVRRAPHEFKIACLEDIKALFPADTNPFYAGFGNRDTDELSYLKIGIPRNKIFIINPKGEIIVNRRVDTKSYSSLHSLVHGMFPSMSSSEQEDFNSWNYWKLPPPTIDE